MLNKILSAIDGKAQDEIAKLLAEKERAICNLEQQHQKALDEKRKKALEDLRNRAQAEVEDFQQKTCLRVRFKLQEERNKLMEKVYGKAQEEVAQSTDEQFERVIKGLISFLTEDIEGEVLAGKRTAPVLRHLSLNRKCALRDTLPEEGFVFRSEDMEIDLRVSQVLKQNREQTDPRVVEILFS